MEQSKEQSSSTSIGTELAKQMLLFVQHENITSLGLWPEEKEECGWKPRCRD